tara:strand:- start:28 stop:510 length:483 start_codon:yes stop_codon:yes gene_type:complete
VAVEAEAAVAAKEVKAVAEVTAEVEDAEVGSVIVHRESAMIMVDLVEMEVMEDLEAQVLDTFGMEIMLSQHILVLLVVAGKAGRAALLGEAAVEVMVEMVVMEEDLSQMVITVVMVKAVVKAVAMNKVADTEVVVAGKEEEAAEVAEATLVKYPSPTMVV